MSEDESTDGNEGDSEAEPLLDGLAIQKSDDTSNDESDD